MQICLPLQISQVRFTDRAGVPPPGVPVRPPSVHAILRIVPIALRLRIARDRVVLYDRSETQV
eukprot:2601212-Prymnesium_polylepis.1